jgi:hypothetical protein
MYSSIRPVLFLSWGVFKMRQAACLWDEARRNLPGLTDMRGAFVSVDTVKTIWDGIIKASRE